MYSVLHTPLSGEASGSRSRPAPALYLTRTSASSELVILGHFLNTLLYLSWQNGSLVLKSSVYLSPVPHCQRLEGSLYVSIICSPWTQDQAWPSEHMIDVC